jgi:hypothetical protein
MALAPISGGNDLVSGASYLLDAGYIQSGVAFPSCRVDGTGVERLYINKVRAYGSGRGASRTARMSFGTNETIETATWTQPSAGSAQSTGWRNISGEHMVNNPSSTSTFRLHFNGAYYFGRGDTGNDVVASPSGFTFANGLAGEFEYFQVPSAPRSLTVVPNADGSAFLDWSAPTEDGDTPVTSYRVQRATNSAFTSGVTTVNTGTTTTNHTMTGLTPGTKYYFRVAARNLVTNDVNSYSVYSGTVSATIPVVNTSGFQPWTEADVWDEDATTEVWDGGAWVPAESVEAWDGAAWVASE